MFHDWPDELIRHLMCISSSFSPDIVRLEGLSPPATMLKNFKEELSMVISANPTWQHVQDAVPYNMFRTQFRNASAVRGDPFEQPLICINTFKCSNLEQQAERDFDSCITHAQRQKP
ncbi:hypothetical protein L3X38_035597 [Prunus dulcis]|uniref:Uncharacterized protein n=1 Tax=Prunus dulcis TaxID=3755 RepID=A0AAD4VK83_PRUDU|nr:hypothetical protein L3X38_035597 [Prunus dulcis]